FSFRQLRVYRGGAVRIPHIRLLIIFGLIYAVTSTSFFEGLTFGCSHHKVFHAHNIFLTCSPRHLYHC
ncbi:hypothetical protein DL96DRAFT_1824228, partial [Flagelloscypha sp. PMI_526]